MELGRTHFGRAGGIRAVWAVITVLVVIAGWFFWRQLRMPNRGALASREIAAWGLAKHLANEGVAANRVLVIGNPFTQQSGRDPQIYSFESTSLDGLRAGFGADVAVAYPELRPQVAQDPGAIRVPPKTSTPLSYLISQGAVDQLLAKHPGTEMVISLIGIPANLDQSKAWRDPKGPRFAFLFPDWNVLGNPNVVRAAFKSKKIAGAVLAKPGAPDTAPSRGNYEEEFEKRFVLITSANFQEL